MKFMYIFSILVGMDVYCGFCYNPQPHRPPTLLINQNKHFQKCLGRPSIRTLATRHANKVTQNPTISSTYKQPKNNTFNVHNNSNVRQLVDLPSSTRNGDRTRNATANISRRLVTANSSELNATSNVTYNTTHNQLIIICRQLCSSLNNIMHKLLTNNKVKESPTQKFTHILFNISCDVCSKQLNRLNNTYNATLLLDSLYILGNRRNELLLNQSLNKILYPLNNSSSIINKKSFAQIHPSTNSFVPVSIYTLPFFTAQTTTPQSSSHYPFNRTTAGLAKLLFSTINILRSPLNKSYTNLTGRYFNTTDRPILRQPLNTTYSPLFRLYTELILPLNATQNSTCSPLNKPYNTTHVYRCQIVPIRNLLNNTNNKPIRPYNITQSLYKATTPSPLPSFTRNLSNTTYNKPFTLPHSTTYSQLNSSLQNLTIFTPLSNNISSPLPNYLSHKTTQYILENNTNFSFSNIVSKNKAQFSFTELYNKSEISSNDSLYNKLELSTTYNTLNEITIQQSNSTVTSRNTPLNNIYSRLNTPPYDATHKTLFRSQSETSKSFDNSKNISKRSTYNLTQSIYSTRKTFNNVYKKPYKLQYNTAHNNITLNTPHKGTLYSVTQKAPLNKTLATAAKLFRLYQVPHGNKINSPRNRSRKILSTTQKYANGSTLSLPTYRKLGQLEYNITHNPQYLTTPSLNKSFSIIRNLSSAPQPAPQRSPLRLNKSSRKVSRLSTKLYSIPKLQRRVNQQQNNTTPSLLLNATTKTQRSFNRVDQPQNSTESSIFYPICSKLSRKQCNITKNLQPYKTRRFCIPFIKVGRPLYSTTRKSKKIKTKTTHSPNNLSSVSPNNKTRCAYNLNSSPTITYKPINKPYSQPIYHQIKKTNSSILNSFINKTHSLINTIAKPQIFVTNISPHKTNISLNNKRRWAYNLSSPPTITYKPIYKPYSQPIYHQIKKTNSSLFNSFLNKTHSLINTTDKPQIFVTNILPPNFTFIESKLIGQNTEPIYNTENTLGNTNGEIQTSKQISLHTTTHAPLHNIETTYEPLINATDKQKIYLTNISSSTYNPSIYLHISNSTFEIKNFIRQNTHVIHSTENSASTINSEIQTSEQKTLSTTTHTSLYNITYEPLQNLNIKPYIEPTYSISILGYRNSPYVTNTTYASIKSTTQNLTGISYKQSIYSTNNTTNTIKNENKKSDLNKLQYISRKYQNHSLIRSAIYNSPNYKYNHSRYTYKSVKLPSTTKKSIRKIATNIRQSCISSNNPELLYNPLKRKCNNCTEPYWRPCDPSPEVLAEVSKFWLNVNKFRPVRKINTIRPFMPIRDIMAMMPPLHIPILPYQIPNLP